MKRTLIIAAGLLLAGCMPTVGTPEEPFELVGTKDGCNVYLVQHSNVKYVITLVTGPNCSVSAH